MNKFGDSLIYTDKNLAPLMTREEEIKYGEYLKSDNKELIDEAREKFISSNIRLVMKIARVYKSYSSFGYEDIVSEGMVGLSNGAEKYDIDRGVKFSTFASFWIKQGILRAFQNKARVVRLPVGLQQKMSHVRKYIEEHKFQSGCSPTKKNLQNLFGISELVAFNILNNSYAEFSIDAPVNNDESGGCASKMDLIDDVAQRSPSSQCEDSDEQVLVKKYLSRLKHRERTIIIKRFGLNNTDNMTLEQVGADLNLTRERIRQIETVALAKLSHMVKEDGRTYA